MMNRLKLLNSCACKATAFGSCLWKGLESSRSLGSLVLPFGLGCLPCRSLLCWLVLQKQSKVSMLLAIWEGVRSNQPRAFFQKVRWMTFGRSPVTQHPWWEQTAMAT